MKLDLLDHVTLDNDKTFIVSNITSYEDKKYYLLLNKNDDSDIMIAYLDNSELVSVNDAGKYILLMKQFNTSKILQNFSISEIINMKEKYDPDIKS